MYCIKCGKQLKEGNKYCIFCGAEIIPEREYDTGHTEAGEESVQTYSGQEIRDMEYEQHSSGGLGILLKILIGALVLVIIAGGGYIFYSFVIDNGTSKKKVSEAEMVSEVSEEIELNKETGSSKDMSNEKTNSSQESEVDDAETEDELSKKENDTDDKDDSMEDAVAQNSEEVNSNEEFDIDSNTEADYRNVLDPDDFGYYSSRSIPMFSFYYPYHLYNRVLKDTSITDSSLGENEEEISFFADDNSSLIFTAISRTDDASLDEASKYVYEEEKAHIKDVSDIWALKVSDGKGFFIITGWDKENTDNMIYEMVRVEKDYIYIMKTLFPDFTGNQEEKNQKSYFTECLYRTCGFSNSSKSPRSYEEYLDEVEN